MMDTETVGRSASSQTSDGQFVQLTEAKQASQDCADYKHAELHLEIYQSQDAATAKALKQVRSEKQYVFK